MTYQWLGSPTRRTLWHTSPRGALCLGYIQPEGDGWAVYVATDPGPNVPTAPARLRWLDDAEAAARTMCAWWRVPYLALEQEEISDEL